MPGYGKRKILVIDDDPKVCTAVSEALVPHGFDVISSTLPDDGIFKAREHKPDLIFISLLLRESNGLKVSKFIHASDALNKTPVIMLISYAGELDPRYTMTIGIHDVIVKPVHADEIVSKTLKILGEAAPPSGEDKTVDIPAAEDEFVSLSIEEESSVSEADEIEYASGADESRGAAEEIFELSEDDDTSALFADKTLEGVSETGFPEDSPFPEDESSALTEMEEDYPEIDMDAEPAEEPGDFRKTREEHDEAELMLSEEEQEEDIESPHIGEYDFSEEPKKSLVRKYGVIAAAVLVVAAVGIGILQVRKTFSPGTESSGPPVGEQAVPERGAPGQKETVTETLPLDEKKTQTVSPQTETSEQQPPSREATVPQAQPSAKSFYSVQVGAFSNENNARSLVDTLKSKGYDAFINTDVIGGGKTIHRVLIGKFSDGKKALEHSRTVQQKEGIKSFVFHN